MKIWLTRFLAHQSYRSGELLTGELKEMCIAVLQHVVKTFQDVSLCAVVRSNGLFTHRTNIDLPSQNKAKVTDDIVRQFMDAKRAIDPTVPSPGSTAHRQAEAHGMILPTLPKTK